MLKLEFEYPRCPGGGAGATGSFWLVVSGALRSADLRGDSVSMEDGIGCGIFDR